MDDHGGLEAPVVLLMVEACWPRGGQLRLEATS